MEFMFDVETIGVESNSVVLSAALTPFSFEETVHDPVAFYGELLDRTVFVKFNADDQISKGRKIERDALDWWKTLPHETRLKSFHRDPEHDLDPVKGLQILSDAIKEKTLQTIEDHSWQSKYSMWQRGGLDQIVFDSLCSTYDFERPTSYWLWYDVRTFLALTKTSTVRGYTKIPGFDNRAHVKKHDPVHDCAYDVLMMLAGE